MSSPTPPPPPSDVDNDNDASTDLAALRETMQDKMPELDDLRQMGNHQFSQGNFDHALTLYNLAVETARQEKNQDALVVNLSNRSATLFRMERYEDAQVDAQEAVDLTNGRNAKATYRLAKTLIALEKYEESVKVLQSALKETESDATKGQLKALQDLLEDTRKRHGLTEPQEEEVSIKYVKRGVSIREFDILEELGVGNFSEIHSCRHKKTGEEFALKTIAKKRAADLAKRQHPNVYNEINMERKVLLERLPPYKYIVEMYHAFQDYNSLYFLMELHTVNTDLWSTIRYQGKMVGTYRSLIKTYLSQMLDALEHMHTHGIVHRDLKPENVQLSARGHLIVLDFGTAKDLIDVEYNGPEFVGTPDFMCPEAVKGTSAPQEVEQDKEKGIIGADHTLDLWAFGAVAFILHSGQTPFWSPSPYLTFLKIKRGNLYRPWGIADDDAWDLIQKLMQVEPTKRLGADCFKVIQDKDKNRTIEKVAGGYNIIRMHPYFSGKAEDSKEVVVPPKDVAMERTPIPSLSDLCIPAVAELVRKDSLDLDLCDKHPPGDKSSHDVLRLSRRDLKCVMHFLDRLQVLREPRIYRRFFASTIDFRLDKIREDTRDYVGLTQMNDNQGRYPVPGNDDPYAKPVKMDPINFVYLTNPLFVKEINLSCDSDERKMYTKLLKKCIANINRARPRVVVVSGFVDESCRKLLARISDSIPVVAHDGSTFFSFWLAGAQGIMLRSMDCAMRPTTGGDEEEENGFQQGGSFIPQLSWLEEQLEESRMSKHQVFVFADTDPRELPLPTQKRLAKGKSSCILGPCTGDSFVSEVSYTIKQSDDASTRSTDSDEDESDNHTTQIIGTAENGLRWITVEEHGKWKSEFTKIEVAPASS